MVEFFYVFFLLLPKQNRKSNTSESIALHPSRELRLCIERILSENKDICGNIILSKTFEIDVKIPTGL